MMNNILKALESGKQRGHSKSIEIDGEIIWCDAAIQKYNGKYKAHVSVIKEVNMYAEKYEVYFTREFTTMSESLECIKLNGYVRIEEFSALKGQKIFNQDYNEENEV